MNSYNILNFTKHALKNHSKFKKLARNVTIDSLGDAVYELLLSKDFASQARHYLSINKIINIEYDSIYSGGWGGNTEIEVTLTLRK